ncbi:sodium:solute symporter family transporter [Cognatazoarcus halotolerans]|uniref:sodium:solute symporter family transporter n=1 Tax=Cognatazoarcus halotolerans TaxID=2686016 RepID=UPI00135726C5|nr:sodium:solute symporter [Cognatazoarcus halotolerans]MCB1901985.1 hypothetical protein [Rhodocyclaceae bacterium]MCP5310008.1 sodium:solute symporter [Zoogloeaceae bacterium]
MNIDVVVILGYLALMIVCGLFAMKRLSSTADYLVADRNLPYWVYFPCLSTVILGGGSTFGSASQSFQHGMSGAWITLMFGLGVVTVGLGFAGRLSRLRVFTLSEMLERRYAHGTRFLRAVVACIYAALISVVQIVALGAVLKALLGWDLTVSILVGGFVTVAYTLVGGMLAITITDLIQFVLMTIGIAILIPFGIDAAGGMAAISAAVPPEFFTLTNISGTRLLGLFMSLYLGIMIGQDIWQRIFTARNERVAAVGSISAGIYSIGWGAAMGVCGILAYVLLPGLESPQDALPALVVKVMPAGLSGIVLAALMSALMSTVSSTILASATLVTNDLLKPALGFDEGRELAVSRWVTAGVSVCVIVLAVFVGDVFVALDTAYAYLSGRLFVPIMAALFWRKATWQGALAAILVGATVVTAALLHYGSAAAEPVIFGILSSAVAMGLVSVLVGGPRADDLSAWNEVASEEVV